MEVLANHRVLVFDQQLYKNKPRGSDVQVVRNSSYDSKCHADGDKRIKDNYQYLEQRIQFNRLKTQVSQADQAVRTKNRFTKKDFSFGKLEMPKTPQIKATPIAIAGNASANVTEARVRTTAKSIFD